MFGFESEYTIDQTVKILKFYAPAHLPATEWLSLKDEQRVEWLRAAVKRKMLGSKESGLIKITEEPDLNFLPEKPIFDDTGNLELIIGPFDNYLEWRDNVKKLNATFGVGSQQAMISAPVESLFPADHRKSLSETEGVFNFLHEFDTLSRMFEGFVKYQKEGNKEVLRTFYHPFLGPMTLAKQKYMHLHLDNLARFHKTDFDGFFVTSSKYIGSTTPRPDIGSKLGRMGAEVRDAHNSETKLFEKTDRISLFFLADRSQMSRFEQLNAVDTLNDYNKFSPETRSALEHLFPSRKDQTFGAAHEVFALDVFRNFSYPLKDWNQALMSLSRIDLLSRVLKAQEDYSISLNKITSDLNSGKTTTLQARIAVQVACAKFSSDSGLYDAFNNEYQNILVNLSSSIQ